MPSLKLAAMPSCRHNDAPIRRLRALHVREPIADSLPTTLPDKPLRLLLVERDAAQRAALTETLSAHYQVEAVADGLSAWQAVHRNPPVLVVISLCQPGIDSVVFVRSLRASTPTMMLPVILLSASADRELLLRCLAAGASNFLLKPLGMGELLACLRVELELCSTSCKPRR